jgi:hypothetical protein
LCLILLLFFFWYNRTLFNIISLYLYIICVYFLFSCFNY